MQLLEFGPPGMVTRNSILLKRAWESTRLDSFYDPGDLLWRVAPMIKLHPHVPETWPNKARSPRLPPVKNYETPIPTPKPS